MKAKIVPCERTVSVPGPAEHLIQTGVRGSR